MQLLTIALTALVALLHFGFLILEMFLWTKPIGMKIFRLSPEKAEVSKVLAANQGLYNGFLSAGLFYGLWLGSEGRLLVVFMLGCVVIAGIYGAMTVGRNVVFVQALPAALALGSMFI